MSVQQLLLGASNAAGYNLNRSVRLRLSASAYLNRTPGSAGNRKTWTWSGWVKRGLINHSAALNLFSATGTSFDNAIQFTGGGTNDILRLQLDGNNAGVVPSAAFYRDPSAWYHIVVAVDTTQATAANRVKIYVNGAEIVYGTTTYPTLNYDTMFNSTNAHNIGRSAQGSNLYFDGYLAEVNFIGGQALTPASFGSTNAVTGVWQPAPYTGTYGTNGFYLPFTDNSSVAALGTDFSGNGNTWTVNNISLTAGVTYDSMTDVPTLTSASASNFCVLSPIDNTSNGFQVELTNGNLSLNLGNGGGRATFSVSSGKWYWEITSGTTNQGMFGIVKQSVPIASAGYESPDAYFYWAQTGAKYNNNVGTAYGSALSSGDILGTAFDADAGTITFYKNGVSLGVAYSSLSGTFSPAFDQGNTTALATYNFGQRPFAYTPPTGFVALNTFNLPTATILKGNTQMDATLYTGTALTLNVTNNGSMQPDFVWLKSRSSAYNHALFDSIRGVNKVLFSNGTSSEQTEVAGSLSAFNSNGFTLAAGVAAHAAVNVAGQTFVGWQWKAGGAAVSNTAGSITSQVSANPSAGFSVVTYTGTGANATVGHGLGVAPKLFIVKQRNGTFTWRVYSASLANTQVLYLSATDAATTETTAWNSTTPTSSVFSVGTSTATNGSTNTYVAYCWSEIDGFSKFGSYVGNGSSDGPFIYTGFKPALVLRKGISIAGIPWSIVDDARNPYNLVNANLFPNTSGAESVPSGEVDFLSNGFKFRSSSLSISGETYIYMAFAENPFKNSLAR